MLIKKILKVLVNVDLIIAGISFIVLVAVTFSGVIARYCLNQPFEWLEEVQIWLFLWITFFGGSAAFRKKSHVEIEMVVEALPAAVQKVIGVLIYFVVVSVLCFLFWKGNLLVSQYIQTQSTTNVLHVSSPLIYSAIPLGCALMIINYSVVTIRDFFHKDGSEEGGKE